MYVLYMYASLKCKYEWAYELSLLHSELSYAAQQRDGTGSQASVDNNERLLQYLYRLISNYSAISCFDTYHSFLFLYSK